VLEKRWGMSDETGGIPGNTGVVPNILKATCHKALREFARVCKAAAAWISNPAP